MILYQLADESTLHCLPFASRVRAKVWNLNSVVTALDSFHSAKVRNIVPQQVVCDCQQGAEGIISVTLARGPSLFDTIKRREGDGLTSTA